jgi:hypothetical protein
MKRAIVDGFGYVVAVGGVLCLCLGMADANPWKPGGNKLPRLSAHGQSIAVENMHLSTPNISVVRSRHRR